jgi:hypothetical protein
MRGADPPAVTTCRGHASLPISEVWTVRHRVIDISQVGHNRSACPTSKRTDAHEAVVEPKDGNVETVQATDLKTQAPVTLNVAGESWRFSIAGVTRVGRELFISVVLQGAELCTAVVHVHDHIVWGVTAKEILNRACEWLLSRGTERHVYIELTSPALMS